MLIGLAVYLLVIDKVVEKVMEWDRRYWEQVRHRRQAAMDAVVSTTLHTRTDTYVSEEGFD